MKYIDQVQLAVTSADGYGDQTVEVIATVNALFIQRTGTLHETNTDVVSSDAEIYLDPSDGTVTTNSYRLEGMYIIANPFGQDRDKSWYKIMGVNVGQRKLLTNEVDNVRCTLQKVAGLPYVPIS